MTFYSSHGMSVNNSKTMFMVVNGTSTDKEPIIYKDNNISYCKQYIYLGDPFTDDGNPSIAIKVYSNNKICHVLKFI